MTRIRNEHGQTLIIVALMLPVILGMAGLVINAAQLYLSFQQLKASTNAAALAGAQVLPETSAIATATAYSGVAGGKNAIPGLPNVTMASGYPKVQCLTSLISESMPCVAPANANAIVVTQRATVPTFFAGLFGLPSLTLTATATASMRGSVTSPYNVIILLDTTASMNDTDSDSQCSSTRLVCAEAGVRTLLGKLSPCGAGASGCGGATNGSVANPLDQVSLFTFPAVSSGTAASNYSCNGSPAVQPYATPFPSTSTYKIVNFSSDYRTSSDAASLNSSSHIVSAVGATTSSHPCLQAPGGQGTYYAQAIYSAQAALAAEQSSILNSQNVLIILSDGDATASAANMPGASTTTSTYPSIFYQCQQAIDAAQAATAAGTRVYTIAYGAKAAGCQSDNRACPGASRNDCVPPPYSPNAAITPCTTMQRMASSAATFFSDYTATGSSGSCISASRPSTNLNQIFSEIVGDLTVARLILNGTQ